MLEINTKVVADQGRLIVAAEEAELAEPIDAASILALFFGTVGTLGTKQTHADLELRQADARRAAVCINACRGIPTEDLERGEFTVLSFARWNTLMAMDRLAFAAGAINAADDSAATDHLQGWKVAASGPAETAEILLDVFQDATTICKTMLFQGLAALAEQTPSVSLSNLYQTLAHSPALTPALRLQEFAPGEGSRFLVGVARLPLVDAIPIGGTEDTVLIALIAFGSEHPNDRAYHWFEANPAKHTVLAYEWLEGKFPHLHRATLNAAHHAVAYLLGREAWEARYSPERLDWSPDWQVQLEALRTLAIGEPDTGGNASSAEGKPAAQDAMEAEGEASDAE